MDSHLGHNSGSGTMGQNTVSPDEDGISDESLLDLLRQTSSSDLPGSQTPSATIASHDRRYQHSSASTVPDRKRRLTAPERPARRVVFDSGTDHVPAAVNAPMDVAGQVFTQPIDLTRHDGSPVAEGGGSLLRSGRDEFEINLPGWEPDADVSLCPVCLTEFTFWYRKHHCRKCGRVVCAKCSPHRITIPRQYIVQPPRQELTGAESADEEVREGTEGHRRSVEYALGGGEEVRVCNPCVPDPNLDPPVQRLPATDDYPRSVTVSGTAAPEVNSDSAMHRASRASWYDRRRRGESSVQRPERGMAGHRSTASDVSHPHGRPLHYEQSPHSDSAHNPLTLLLHASHSRSSPMTLTAGHDRLPLNPPNQHWQAQDHHQTQPTTPTRPRRSESSPSASSPASRHSSFRQSLLRQNAPLPSIPSAIPSPQPLPQRQVPEEDECPVCGVELPPRGLEDSDSQREEHVQDCIRIHFAGSSSSVLPRTGSLAAASHTPSTQTTEPGTTVGPHEQLQQLQRPRALTGNRMLVYRATEKHCVRNEDGVLPECIICFEEFQVGDEMGRMECLCNFHRACIRQWWDVKGGGSCPTHQLHS